MWDRDLDILGTIQGKVAEQGRDSCVRRVLICDFSSSQYSPSSPKFRGQKFNKILLINPLDIFARKIIMSERRDQDRIQLA